MAHKLKSGSHVPKTSILVAPMKNMFYFILKAFFVLPSWLFGHIGHVPEFGIQLKQNV